MTNEPRYPLGVYPVRSQHGDVHVLHVVRTNGDSLTVSDLKWVHKQITSRELADRDINFDWFAQEDRV